MGGGRAGSMKMGSLEKQILENAYHSTRIRGDSDKKKQYKRLIEKGWLVRTHYGMFEITADGEEALEERWNEQEKEAQRKL